MFERIKEMVIKEFSQVFRDRRMKAIIFVTPLMQLLVFGYAVTTDVKSISTAYYDLDRSFESRELARPVGLDLAHRPIGQLYSRDCPWPSRAPPRDPAPISA